MRNVFESNSKGFLKRATATLLSAILLLTAMPLQAFAEPVNYDDLTNETARYINDMPVDPWVLSEGENADEKLQDPEQPAIYTLQTDYKVEKDGEKKINFQPYVASVGEKATDEEKAKVDKEIQLPEFKGYETPKPPSYKLTYDIIKEKALSGVQEGFNYYANQEFVYKPKKNTVKIKHVFQDLRDFNKYDKRPEDPEVVHTTQLGDTGALLNITPLSDQDIPGFKPEAPYLTILVPEDATNFEVEYRYNRQSYQMKFDTEGGTPVASRVLYYGQIMPKVEEPTKVGAIFLGWKPSVELEGEVGGVAKTFNKDELITDASGNAVKDLDANLIMPSRNVTFTAVWQEKTKADYTILFWSEKSDYDDKNTNLTLRDRYDFIGAKVIKDAQTGLRPDLTQVSINGIRFPNLENGRMEQAWADSEVFAKYYFLNEELTRIENVSESNPNVQKAVSSTGETVYNVYYDRRVYTLYFTSTNNEYDDNAYFPIITRDGQVLGREGAPYKVDVRFNQSLDKIWPKDEEISGLPLNHTSDPSGDDGLIGWMINNNNVDYQIQIFRDTPPYRLSAEDFIDAEDVMSIDEENGGMGHADEIPIADGKTKKRDKYEISLGASYMDTAMVHHIDIIKDDFEGNEQIDYDLSYWKSDTSAYDYEFILPHLQGFTLKAETRPAILVGKRKVDDVKKTFDELNAERNEKTPFRSDADKIEYISHFPWSEKLFNGTNAYDYANYYRNKYKLKLNNDPKREKNDSEYTDGVDRFDVFYERPLKDLNADQKKPVRPAWVPADWEFKGYCLDPAGKNLVKDGNETMPNYDLILYAKWDEPDVQWKVTIDPAGGELPDLDVRDLVNPNAQGEYLASKKPNEGNNQVFEVQHRQTLKNIPTPTRKGYDFLGWEWVRYLKDAEGNITGVDTSYRETYGVPELYPFGNNLVSDVYVKAIWIENNKMQVIAYHHFIDEEGFEIKDALREIIIPEARAHFYVSASAKYQNEEWILVPHAELVNSPDEEVRTVYTEYNDRLGFNNTGFHSIKVEPNKIMDAEGNMVDNPNVKNNVFHFYYRHFKTRNYKVNYLDIRVKDKISEINASGLSEEEKKDAIAQAVIEYSIIDQEPVVSKNRHYDARNYRSIPGWTLVSEPQQQLFYDIDENTGEFKGINGTNSDEITFFYRDSRVVEIKDKDDPIPQGYIRVTFKSGDGGSFTDKDGNSVKEVYYDVIKGLKSDNLFVPQEFNEGDVKEAKKYYITPDAGKNFTKWDKKPLLNPSTIIENETPGYYTFTALYDWQGVIAKELVVTESLTGVNDFVPTEEKLKSQIRWINAAGEEADLPADATVRIENYDGIYDELKELNKLDSEELVRTVLVKAKVTFNGNTEEKEVEIPIKVYKNRYEATTTGSKPLFLLEAEKGDLKDVTGDYVKVTVNPTGKPNEKDSKIYYVNPKALVEIPEIILTPEEKAALGFTHWTADIDKQNEGEEPNGIFDFNKRHMFTEETLISPDFSNDIVEQEGDDKPKVPDDYVKVIVKTTDKATVDVTRTFWVNPNKNVTLPVTEPTGKDVLKPDGTKDFTWLFTNWNKPISGMFTEETVITAEYKEDHGGLTPVEPVPEAKGDIIHTDFGVEVTDEEYKKAIKLPDGYSFETGTTFEIDPTTKPNVNKEGRYDVKVWVKYPDGTEQLVEIPVFVGEKVWPDVVEQHGDEKPGVPENYVKVVVMTTDKAEVDETRTFWVNPERIVELPVEDPIGKEVENPDGTKTKWQFMNWDKPLIGMFKEETIITALYKKDGGGLTPIEPIPEARGDFIYTPLGKEVTDEQYKKAVILPNGYSFETGTTLEIVENTRPNINKTGRYNVEAWVNYPDGSGQLVVIRVVVGEAIKPGEDRIITKIVEKEVPVVRERVVTKIETRYKERNVLCREVRYMEGFEGKFRPDDGLTRAEAAKILANALKEDGYKFSLNYPLPYKDIKGDEWFSDAVRITTQADVFVGYEDGEFKPQKKISRAEWIATLRRFQYLDKAEGNDLNMRENHWAIPEVQAAYKKGWLNIYAEGKVPFNYDEPITRKEVAAVSNRAFRRITDIAFIKANEHNLIGYTDIDPSMWAYEEILCASNTFLHQKEGRYIAYERDKKAYSIDVRDAIIEQDLFQWIPR